VTNPRKFYFSRRLRRERHEAEDCFENACALVEKRSAIDAEYFRDLLNGQVAASNLSLQQTIRRLTALALVIGVLAVIISLFPEEVRESIWRFVFGK
jgi:hypothetical protein